MRLKKIEIHGFKSFADKTELEFGKGVTCLVGPNGCGKSNVVDAIKWALGEQRPTALRGDQMGDVIFKGNGRRPAMGFAEVSLVFDNEEENLPIDSAEVAISRRLYRNGDSEYLINRRTCRLKDVRELFVDTGLGQNAYAVLEQGRIDAVLNANPVERRSIFEEAAGIQRFRMRKREASRKLEKVDQNLLRVADLIDELERRVRTLRIQAGRARSYVALTDRLTELRTTQFLISGAEMARQVSELEERLTAAVAADEVSEQQLDEATVKVEEAESGLTVVRESIGLARNERVEVRAELDNGATRQDALRQRESESRRTVEERGAQIAELEQERTERVAEMARLQERIQSSRNELETARQEVERRRAAVVQARADLAARERGLEEMDARVVEMTSAELTLSNLLASLGSQAGSIRAGRERLVRREGELASLLERVRLDAADVDGQIRDLDVEARQGTRSVAEARTELDRRRLREAELKDEISAIVADISGKESRRETLDGVIENMEGVEEGARALVQASRQAPQDGPFELGGVRGLLAELLPVTRERARAVDAALGHLAGAVVVDDRDALDRCIHLLRSDRLGPATFLVLDGAVAAGPGPGQPGADGPGRPLLEGVDVPAGLAGMFGALLGNVRLVDEESDLLRNLGSGRFLVSREGARLESSGAYSDRPQSRAVGFVERKVERDQLLREVDEMRLRLTGLQEEEARIGAEATEWLAAVSEAEQQKQQIEAGIAESRSKAERLRDRAAIYQREMALCVRERLELESDARAVSQERNRAAESLSDRRERRQAAEEERRDLHREREQCGESVDRLALQESEASGEVVRLGERLRGQESEGTLVQRGLDELDSGMTRLRTERDELLRRAEGALEAAHELEQGLLALRDREVEVRDRLEELTGREEEMSAAAVEVRQAALVAAQDREDRREELHQLQLEERELKMNLQSLRERALDEISLDIEAALDEFDVGAAAPLDQVTEELKKVRDKISRIGNVNLDAIHELEEVEERLTFLSREKEDLDGSRKALELTIKELDEVSEVRFLETFNAVRDHFRNLFRKLFHGGKADVQLQEGVPVLDAGIEIIAGPPGKDPRSITLLSGGERTLTAVGLLFSLFKARPAPVAILDEVDAALDESNIERFCNLLSEFVGKSQFLIVTHSKRTMSYADIIFGVTMEESGVSKRVGIRLEEYEERVA